MKHMGTTVNAEGIVTKSYYDNGLIRERSFADISDLLERNLYERNNSNNGFTKEGDMRKIAELDMLTVHRLKTEFNIDVFNNEDMPRLKKWLKDNRAFMTVNGGI